MLPTYVKVNLRWTNIYTLIFIMCSAIYLKIHTPYASKIGHSFTNKDIKLHNQIKLKISNRNTRMSSKNNRNNVGDFLLSSHCFFINCRRKLESFLGGRPSHTLGNLLALRPMCNLYDCWYEILFFTYVSSRCYWIWGRGFRISFPV